MKKYIFYCNIGQMPPHAAKTYMETAIKATRQTGFVRPYEKLICIGVKERDSELEIIKIPFIESMINYFNWFFGEIKDIDTIS